MWAIQEVIREVGYRKQDIFVLSETKERGMALNPKKLACIFIVITDEQKKQSMEYPY